jgi:hypothetical protein
MGGQLWYDIAAKVDGQGDLLNGFGLDGVKPDTRYQGERSASEVSALRLAVLAEVARFIRVNQPSGCQLINTCVI